MDQRHKGTNPVRPSSPRPIHRRIPAAASQSGFPPGTDAGSSAGKPLTLETTNDVSGQETLVQTLLLCSPRPSTVGSQRQRPTNDVSGQETWSKPVRPSSPAHPP
ncbi:hypothetical protein FQN60_005311 [Etheostoma spectabile]|uniref:Uncharacterized protein n=1 Tax=Etheostoma spectabile TaxID=54343 RepID=A0A5J5C6T3_9PERO|nr:hypothetical protein FQN60_005311 [Etheostoma spectabile]